MGSAGCWPGAVPCASLVPFARWTLAGKRDWHRHAPGRCAPAPLLRLQVSGNLVRDCMYPNNDFKTLPQLQVSDWTRRGDKGQCSPAGAGAEIRAALLG